jgi:hypothetical protein
MHLLHPLRQKIPWTSIEFAKFPISIVDLLISDVGTELEIDILNVMN